MSNLISTPERKIVDFSLTDDDSFQYCREISAMEYEFTQIQWCNVLPNGEKQYVVTHDCVDLSVYCMDDIESFLEHHYASLKEFRDAYRKVPLRDLHQIIAECVFEDSSPMCTSVSPAMSMTDCINFQKHKMAEWSQHEKGECL